MPNNNKGVLIHDDNPDHTLPDRVLAAARSYASKFGVPANVVYVHLQAMGTALTTEVGGITVKAQRLVLKHHYFAVREEQDGRT